MKKLTIVLLFAMIGVTITSLASCNKTDDDDSNISIKWVDLGLPSGILWADRNLGASAPEEIGDYFAWGEISTKREYSWNNYIYGNDTNMLTKYCNKPAYGINGFTDTLILLELCDDVATSMFGKKAHIPTEDDWQELMDNTIIELDIYYNVYKFKAANGNSISLPMNGFRYGRYWSKLLNLEFPYMAKCFFFSDGWEQYSNDGISFSSMCMMSRERCEASNVRAVRTP